ncbi:MAG: DUF4340 domain-containing protein, partial [Planctomycetota bacterium]
MNKGNLVLLGVLAALGAAYFAISGGPDAGAPSGPAPRLFPDFKKGSADRIALEGGWPGTSYLFERVGSEWKLQSAGGFPVKAETANKLLDAVDNLRAENRVGDSAELAKETRTDESGRLVRVSAGDRPLAEFRVGKNPKQGWEEFFIRKEGSPEIYRTKTYLTAERDLAPGRNPWDSGGRGFGWNNYIVRATDWTDSKIWDLGDAETQEIVLTRGDAEIKIVRKGQDEWEIAAPEQAPANADAASALGDAVRSLYLVDVVGKEAEVAAQYGLDKPETTLALTLKKKVEKKKEEAEKKPEGEGEAKEGEGEAKEGEQPKPEEKKEEEFVTIRRVLRVGKAIKRPDNFDDEKGTADEAEYHPVAIGGDFDDEAQRTRAEYVYLVRDYSVSSLRKTLEDLKQKPKPEEKKEEKPGGEAEPADAKPGRTRPA